MVANLDGMKISYLHQYYNTPDMIGGTRSHEMARRLVARGHDVTLITSWRVPDEKRGWFQTEEEGVHVHWIPVPYSNRMSYGRRIRAFLQFAWQSAIRAAAIPADVVFATSTPLTIALPAIYASRRQNVPMVFEVRDLWPELPIAMGAVRNPLLKVGSRWLEKYAYGNASRVVALSPGMRDGVVRVGYSPERVTVIPNSADLDLFDPECSDGSAFRSEHSELLDAPLVVYSGTIGKINGVDYLVRIAAAARDQRLAANFVVVGEGQDEGRVRREAERLGVLRRNFHMLPSVPKRDMPKVLAAADVALSLFIDLKPMWANSANKFFDALASGTPVAINYGGWQADLLKQTGAGVVLPANDPERAARLLGDLLGDVSRHRAAGRAARLLAEQRFSRDVLADQLERVLRGAVEGSR
jgi:glycosyltransferase involved in cell wall biosynthesis